MHANIFNCHATAIMAEPVMQVSGALEAPVPQDIKKRRECNELGYIFC